MDIGIVIFPTDYCMDIVELAREAEARNLESLFVPEHTHIPTSRLSPWPGGPELPKEYSHSHDPFVALSFAAAATTKLKVGTAICLLPQRDAIVTAKSVASLDLLSGGRFVFGVGGGWNREEMENHGTEFTSRFKLLEEKLQAMQAIWTEDEAAYHGKMVDFDPLWSWPKPAQQPHPPVLLGGESEHTMRRVVKYCQGWLPRARFNYDVAAGIGQLRRVADDMGRDMSTINISVFGAVNDPAALDSFREAGANRAIMILPSAGRDEILPMLDDFATLVP